VRNGMPPIRAVVSRKGVVISPISAVRCLDLDFLCSAPHSSGHWAFFFFGGPFEPCPLRSVVEPRELHNCVTIVGNLARFQSVREF